MLNTSPLSVVVFIIRNVKPYLLSKRKTLPLASVFSNKFFNFASSTDTDEPNSENGKTTVIFLVAKSKYSL